MSNILRVAFKHERRIESRPLYQYDYGQVLKFIDLELPYSYEVHFSNYEKGSSITQLGNENGVAIPDLLLTSGLPVYVWLYLHTSDADGETEYMVKIPVYKRAAITNDQPTPVQQDVITQTIAALASGVATATNSAAMAIASASEATAARDGARAYMNIAQASADIATASAQQAVTAANHYPIIEEDNWYLWSVANSSYVDTGVNARGSKGDPFTYDDFTPEQLEALTGAQGITFTPTVSPEGVIYWENNGGKENPQAVNIMGPQGIQGETGATFIPSVSSDGVISWTNDKGKENPLSVNIRGPYGIQGETGPSGFSPVIAVSSIAGGHQISITDASGTQSFDVMDGAGSVQSVNNKTGAVVLTAEDVDAIAVPTAASSGQLLGYNGSNWDAVTIDFNGLPSGGLMGQVLAKSSDDDYAIAWTTIHDIPAGGGIGQVLAKSSDYDYDVAWSTIYTVPSGGSTGQVLTKNSETNYDVSWTTPSGGGGEGALYVYFTQVTGNTYRASKTISQIIDAYEQGKTIIGFCDAACYYAEYIDDGEVRFQRPITTGYNNQISDFSLEKFRMYGTGSTTEARLWSSSTPNIPSISPLSFFFYHDLSFDRYDGWSSVDNFFWGSKTFPTIINLNIYDEYAVQVETVAWPQSRSVDYEYDEDHGYNIPIGTAIFVSTGIDITTTPKKQVVKTYTLKWNLEESEFYSLTLNEGIIDFTSFS